MLLNTAKSNRLSQDELPNTIIVISDMEFDSATWQYRNCSGRGTEGAETLMEGIARKWRANGYKVPHLIYWNVNARQNNIPMLGVGRVSFVSGFSPSIFQSIVTGKTGYDLMLETLEKDRYKVIQ